jgi:hypothetical protein
MKTKWKMFLWSSLGSVAVGLTVALMGKSRGTHPRPQVCRRIPRNCARVLLQTERFETDVDGSTRMAGDEYRLQSTPFKVWSVLDLSGEPGRPKREGAVIYHITHRRLVDATGEEPEAISEELFYGTVRTLNPASKACRRNYIARGGIIEMHKCYVGGASNGVETGEIHRSDAPLLNYRFEYRAAPETPGITDQEKIS